MKHDEIKATLDAHAAQLTEQTHGQEARLISQMDEQEATFTKRIDEQEVRLSKLTKRIDKSDEQLRQHLDAQMATFYGQVSARIGTQIEARVSPLEAKIDRLLEILDVNVKKTETDEQERLVMTNQFDRHEGWIGQLADATSTKLVPEQER